MSDASLDLHALLPLQATDRASHVGDCRLTTGLDRGAYHVVLALHRGSGCFRHVYLVPQVRRSRVEVRLVAVFEGSAHGEAERFVRSLVESPAVQDRQDRAA